MELFNYNPKTKVDTVINSIDRKTYFVYNISKGKNSVFLKGWLRRLNGIRYGSLVTNKGEILK